MGSFILSMGQLVSDFRVVFGSVPPGATSVQDHIVSVSYNRELARLEYVFKERGRSLWLSCEKDYAECALRETHLNALHHLVFYDLTSELARLPTPIGRRS